MHCETLSDKPEEHILNIIVQGSDNKILKQLSSVSWPLKSDGLPKMTDSQTSIRLQAASSETICQVSACICVSESYSRLCTVSVQPATMMTVQCVIAQ